MNIFIRMVTAKNTQKTFRKPLSLRSFTQNYQKHRTLRIVVGRWILTFLVYCIKQTDREALMAMTESNGTSALKTVWSFAMHSPRLTDKSFQIAKRRVITSVTAKLPLGVACAFCNFHSRARHHVRTYVHSRELSLIKVDVDCVNHLRELRDANAGKTLP